MLQQRVTSGEGAAAATLERLLRADGTAAHPHAMRLIGAGTDARDLGDAMHALCAVHGHHPDLPTIAATAGDAAARAWLESAARDFGADRAALAQLVAAAGPLPSTPGQAESAAALSAERQTLVLLVQSERQGVAAGAVAALFADWPAVRGVMAAAATRFGLTLSLPPLPDPAALIADAPARAAAFGAQQLLAQHRGLWSLLEARSSARRH